MSKVFIRNEHLERKAFCDEASFTDRETELFCRPKQTLANLDEHCGPNISCHIFLALGCNGRAFIP